VNKKRGRMGEGRNGIARKEEKERGEGKDVGWGRGERGEEREGNEWGGGKVKRKSGRRRRGKGVAEDRGGES